MAFSTLFNFLFNLVNLLGTALILVAAILAIRAIRNPGSLALLVGAVLQLFAQLFWIAFQFLISTGKIAPDSSLFMKFLPIMQGFTALATALVAVGVLMLAMVLGKVIQQNRTIENALAERPQS